MAAGDSFATFGPSWMPKSGGQLPGLGIHVVVNLRPPSDARTAFVSFNQARVVQVLKRIAADLDRLSGRRTPSETLDATVGPITAGVKHRQRLVEPEPLLASLSQREQRAILREKIGLPPL